MTGLVEFRRQSKDCRHLGEGCRRKRLRLGRLRLGRLRSRRLRCQCGWLLGSTVMSDELRKEIRKFQRACCQQAVLDGRVKGLPNSQAGIGTETVYGSKRNRVQ